MVQAGVKDKTFAVIGDSTFFHGGLPGLLNISYNNANVCVVILDNRTVAMTGHQPTPGSGKNAMGEDAKKVDIATIARSLGIDKVEIVDPYDIEESIRVIREIVEHHGPSVIISERPCPLKIPKGTPRKILENCNNCGLCVNAYGCPAISMNADRVEIDETLCAGCGVCEQVCPFGAIGSVN